MKVKKHILSFMVVFCALQIPAQATFKTMFYNLLNYPLEDAVPNRISDLYEILDDYQPDLFMVCELNNLNGANDILQTMQLINSNYAATPFVTNSSDDDFGNQNDLQNLVFYDQTKFIYQNYAIVPTNYRDFNIYTFKLNTENQDTNPILLRVIVCHLKSSSGTENAQRRLEMVQELTEYLNGLDLTSNDYLILGGDLNIYTNTENAFEELLNLNMDSDSYPLSDSDPTRISFIDPTNQLANWRNNSSQYLGLYTQSTRTQTGLGGATGGFDDRFDFILTSANMESDPTLKYVANSYKAYGNNNNQNCHNREINSSFCSGSEYSQSIRDALYNFSDHLPVTLELETNENLLNNNSFTHNNNSIEFVNTNITDNHLSLKANLNAIKTNKLIVFNTLGQSVLNLSFSGSSNIITIDVSALNSGIYYIVIPSLNVEPLKFVKTD